MKKVVLFLLTVIITFIISILIFIYNIKVVDVENGNITLGLFGYNFVYYFEK